VHLGPSAAAVHAAKAVAVVKSELSTHAATEIVDSMFGRDMSVHGAADYSRAQSCTRVWGPTPQLAGGRWVVLGVQAASAKMRSVIKTRREKNW
jgi:hypothetical protein